MTDSTGAPAHAAPIEVVSIEVPSETVQGDVVDAEEAAADVEQDRDVATADAIDGEVADDVPDDGAYDDGQEAGTPGTDRDDDVMVLATWQIELPATGDDAVDAALARLTEVEGLPPTEHAEVYEAVHAGLQDALADLDRG